MHRSPPPSTSTQNRDGVSLPPTNSNAKDDEVRLLGAKVDSIIDTMNQLSLALGQQGLTLPNVAGTLPGTKGKGPKKSKGAPRTSGNESNGHDSGKNSARTRRRDSSSDFAKTSSDGDDSDDDRRPRRNHRKTRPGTLPGISQFKFGEANENWTSWIKQFRNTVKGHTDPRDRADLNKTCLKLLPAYLNSLAHDIYTNSKHKSDWDLLKKELEDAFEDPEIRQNWKTNLGAYKWDGSQPLNVYKGNIVRLVNKYDTEIRETPAALDSAYYSRFHAGLPEDYQGFIEQQLYEGKQTIDYAVRSAQRFQAWKKKQKDKPPEISAATTFENTNTHERLRAVEHGIERINTHINRNSAQNQNGNRYPSKDRTSSASSDHRPGNSRYSSTDRYSSGDRVPNGGRYPNDRHPSGDRFSSGSRYSSGDRHPSRDRFTRQRVHYEDQGARPRDNAYYRGRAPQRRDWGTRDRIDRFRNRQQGRGGPQTGRQDPSNTSGFTAPFSQKDPYADYKRRKEEQTVPHMHTQEGAGLLQSEVESEAEDDLTMAAFQEWREQNEEEEFERFAASKHEAENY